MNFQKLPTPKQVSVGGVLSLITLSLAPLLIVVLAHEVIVFVTKLAPILLPLGAAVGLWFVWRRYLSRRPF